MRLSVNQSTSTIHGYLPVHTPFKGIFYLPQSLLLRQPYFALLNHDPPPITPYDLPCMDWMSGAPDQRQQDYRLANDQEKKIS